MTNIKVVQTLKAMIVDTMVCLLWAHATSMLQFFLLDLTLKA